MRRRSAVLWPRRPPVCTEQPFSSCLAGGTLSGRVTWPGPQAATRAGAAAPQETLTAGNAQQTCILLLHARNVPMHQPHLAGALSSQAGSRAYLAFPEAPLHNGPANCSTAEAYTDPGDGNVACRCADEGKPACALAGVVFPSACQLMVSERRWRAMPHQRLHSKRAGRFGWPHAMRTEAKQCPQKAHITASDPAVRCSALARSCAASAGWQTRPSARARASALPACRWAARPWASRAPPSPSRSAQNWERCWTARVWHR